MKYSNIKYGAIVTVDGKEKGHRYFATEKGYSNYANEQFKKYGDGTRVLIYDFVTLKNITEYVA